MVFCFVLWLVVLTMLQVPTDNRTATIRSIFFWQYSSVSTQWKHLMISKFLENLVSLWLFLYQCNEVRWWSFYLLNISMFAVLQINIKLLLYWWFIKIGIEKEKNNKMNQSKLWEKYLEMYRNTPSLTVQLWTGMQFSQKLNFEMWAVNWWEKNLPFFHGWRMSRWCRAALMCWNQVQQM